MRSDNIADIKRDLKRTNRAVVAIGCSFVQGAELGNNPQEKNDFSFINVLCKEFFKGEYTPINFGQEGAGNYAAISRLFLYDIPWRELDDLIVLFLPSGMQRFDIIKDENCLGIGHEFKTLWPFYAVPRVKNDENWVSVNHNFGKTCYSEKFEVLNAVLNFNILNSWVKSNSARLFIFPAFSREYNKEHFKKEISKDIYRNNRTMLHDDPDKYSNHYDYDYLIDSIPWDRFITIKDSTNFFELCFKNDKNYDPKYSMQNVVDFRRFYNNDWIMPRGHPSAQGHRLLAEELHKILAS